MNNFYTQVSQVGNRILHRWIDGKTGKHKAEIVSPSVELFTPTKNQNTPYRSIRGNPLQRHEFDKIKDAKDFVKQYGDVSNMEIHGNQNWWAQFISDTYPGTIEFDDSKIILAWIDIETETGTKGFPEPKYAENKVLSITVGVRYNHQVKWFLFGMKDYRKNDDEVFKKCEDEFDLLYQFLEFWGKLSPDVVSHWNGDNFDLPYLYNRIQKVLGEPHQYRLDPVGYALCGKMCIRESYMNKDEYMFSGFVSLDYMKMYKKFTFKTRESYSLGHITSVELGDTKTDYSDYSNLDDLYERNPQLFYEYNIQDVKLLDQLDQKLNLIMLFYILSYKMKIPYDKMFSQVAMWDTYIYNGLREQNIVVPPKTQHTKNQKYAGAYVMEPIKKLHKWVLSFDLNSLYPSIMRNLLISPENIINDDNVPESLLEYWDYDSHKVKIPLSIDDFVQGKNHSVLDSIRKEGLAISPNGSVYGRNENAIIPSLLAGLYDERREAKNKQLDAEKEVERIKGLLKQDEDNPELKAELDKFQRLAKKYKVFQMAAKVTLNSCYGALGNEYSRFYDVRMAEGVTLFGQLAIRWVSNHIENYLSNLLGDGTYVIYNDTDSSYITLEKLVDKLLQKSPDMTTLEIVDFLDNFAESKLQDVINNAYDELKEYVNAKYQMMVMKREVIASAAFWRAKKNYAMLIYDSEGVRYENGKLKVVGIETERSSTPKVCREELDEMIKTILIGTEDELQKRQIEFREKFNKMEPELIAFPRGVSDIEKWMDGDSGIKSGTPIHVYGSIVFNNLIKQKGKQSVYPFIRSGSKIKFVYLQKINPTRSHVLSFIDKYPDDMLESKYVDRGTQYEKAFLQPLKSITDIVGWEPIKTASLF